MAATGIVLKNLVVKRGTRAVVDGLSLHVSAGSVYALLGANGAGKSTALFAILGLLKPVSGTIIVNGYNPVTARAQAQAACAYLPETVALYEHLSARENVVYFLSLAGQAHLTADIEAAFTSVRLPQSAWDQRLGTFSKGMRQKTAIALALLRKTPILLLDEPTTGLDPTATQDFHGLLEDLKVAGVAVLMVTHDLLGACDVADCIGLMVDGQLAAQWDAQQGGPRFDLQELHKAFCGATSKQVVA